MGVGYGWSPVILGPAEIQINDQLAAYLNVAVGDTVELTVGATGALSSN